MYSIKHEEECFITTHVHVSSTAVKRPRHFPFYLVGFYLILHVSGNMGKDE